MNCDQFEQRVQQQLDNRANLALDSQLQRHARQCRCCASALSLYMCLVEDSAKRAALVSATSDAAMFQPKPAEPRSGRRHASRSLRRRNLGFAVAAILLISLLPWIPSQMNQQTADNQAQPLYIWPDQALAPQPAFQSFPDSIDFGSWLYETMPGNLVRAADLDFANIGQFDVVSWIPKEPVNAVRMLPVTIETIQPIYQYSVELPVVNYWSSGLNYTLGLIRYKWENSSNSQQLDKAKLLDLGVNPAVASHKVC